MLCGVRPGLFTGYAPRRPAVNESLLESFQPRSIGRSATLDGKLGSVHLPKLADKLVVDARVIPGGPPLALELNPVDAAVLGLGLCRSVLAVCTWESCRAFLSSRGVALHDIKIALDTLTCKR